MNIGIVTFWFERGAAYVSRAYLEALSTEHKVFIYARGGEDYPVDDPRWNIENVTWGKQPKNLEHDKYIYWSDFQKWIKNNKIEVLIFNEQKNWDIVLKLKKSRILLGSYIDYYTFDTVPFFTLYDFLLIHTKRHYSVFKHHPQPLFVPWGTDTDLCKPRTDAIKLTKEVVFFHSAGMGGINLRKGTDLVVKAFSQLRGPAKLIIHSQVGIEKYSSVRELIEHDSRIEFIQGSYPPPGLYHLGDVYVYPSRLEGIGLSIVEALASGLPVITTDAPPMNEFVTHGRNGYLVEVEKTAMREDRYYWPESISSLDALVGAMQYYIDNPGIVKALGFFARKSAVEDFNWNKNSEEFRNLLKKARIRPERLMADENEIRKYEAAHNIFLLNAKRFFSKGENRDGYRALAQMAYHHPGMLLNRITWQTVNELLRRNREKRSARIIRLFEKRFLTRLPGRIQQFIQFNRVSRPINESGLFDRVWYLNTYPDVRESRINPLFHYIFHGGYEGRNPSVKFDSEKYLSFHEDVLASGMNPLVHYIKFGKAEKRRIFHRDQALLPSSKDEMIYKTEIDHPVISGNQPTVDVVVYLSSPALDSRDSLESIISTTNKHERIIIVNDQQDQNSRRYLDYLEQIFSGKVSQVTTTGTLGLAKAYNIGLSLSNCEYIILTTGSAVVHGDWVQKLSRVASISDSIGIVGPITPRTGKSASSCLDIMDEYSQDYAISYDDPIADTNQKLERWAEHKGYPIVPFVDSLCMLVKRKTYEKIGSFDAISFPEGSAGVGVDYCLRAVDSGFECVLATDTLIKEVNH